jgi:hypothetical protein
MRPCAVFASVGEFRASYPRKLVVETSEDGGEWNTVASERTAGLTMRGALNDPKTVPIVIGLSPSTARFVRLRIDESHRSVPWMVTGLVIRNADGHKFWMNSRAIANAGIDARTPDPPQGTIGRDANRVPNGFFADYEVGHNTIRFFASFDGGASFTPSVRVSQAGASFPPGTSREKRPATPARDDQERLKAQIDAGRDSFMFMGGDTAGLAADASGIFHAAWVDNRTGVPQLWTATITVPSTSITRARLSP